MSFTIYHIVCSILIGYLLGCLFKNKEGFIGYDESQDESGAGLDINECDLYNGSLVSSISPTILESNKCAFKELDCGGAMLQLGDDSTWSWFGENESISKQNCKQCIQGSQLENTLVTNIANISQEFASHYCDALFAECDNHSLYSNSKDNWSSKCDTISNKTNVQEAVCTIDNPGLQWILNFINSPMCDLNIEALKIQRTFTNAISEVGDFFEEANPFG